MPLDSCKNILKWEESAKFSICIIVLQPIFSLACLLDVFAKKNYIIFNAQVANLRGKKRPTWYYHAAAASSRSFEVGLAISQISESAITFTLNCLASLVLCKNQWSSSFEITKPKRYGNWFAKSPVAHPTNCIAWFSGRQQWSCRENCSTFNNDEDVIQGGNSATSIFQATNWILLRMASGDISVAWILLLWFHYLPFHLFVIL